MKQTTKRMGWTPVRMLIVTIADRYRCGVDAAEAVLGDVVSAMRGKEFDELVDMAAVGRGLADGAGQEG